MNVSTLSLKAHGGVTTDKKNNNNNNNNKIKVLKLIN